MQVFARDLHEHVAKILIVALRRETRLPDVPAPDLARGARDKVINSVLRLNPLVEMVVAGEDGIYAVLHEKRLQEGAQLDVRAVPAPGGVDRVVEKTESPDFRGALQFLIEPRQLLLVHECAVQSKKTDSGTGKTVIAPPTHIEVFIVALLCVVMVSE